MYYKYGKDEFVVGTKSYTYDPSMQAMVMSRDQEALKRAVMPVKVEVKSIPLHELGFTEFRKFVAGIVKPIEFFGKPGGMVEDPLGKEGLRFRVFVKNSEISFYFHFAHEKVLNLGFAE